MEEEFSNHMLRFQQVQVSSHYFNKLHFGILGWIDNSWSWLHSRNGWWWAWTPENGAFLFSRRSVAYWNTAVCLGAPGWDHHPHPEKIQNRCCNRETRCHQVYSRVGDVDDIKNTKFKTLHKILFEPLQPICCNHEHIAIHLFSLISVILCSVVC